jgi:hypothetical protein
MRFTATGPVLTLRINYWARLRTVQQMLIRYKRLTQNDPGAADKNFRHAKVIMGVCNLALKRQMRKEIFLMCLLISQIWPTISARN